MIFFAGIVPPADIYHTILSIQNKYGNNRLEPHITLRPPVSLTHVKEWIDTIEQAARNSNPFRVSLPQTRYFDSRVLYISVESVPLVNLYNLLIPALKPFEATKDIGRQPDVYHPHLTLGRSWCGFSGDDFAAMQQLANQYLQTSPIEFMAKFIRVYYKSDAQKGYQTYKDIPMGS